MWEWIVEQSVNKAPIVALVEFVLLIVGSFVAWWRHESIKAEFRKQVERLKQYARYVRQACGGAATNRGRGRKRRADREGEPFWAAQNLCFCWSTQCPCGPTRPQSQGS